MRARPHGRRFLLNPGLGLPVGWRKGIPRFGIICPCLQRPMQGRARHVGRALPLLTVLRMAACTSWPAEMWSLIMCPSRSKHSLAMYVCTRVRYVAERVFVRRGLAISLCEFAVVELSVVGCEEGGSLLRVGL